mmetsp:Transcript_98345/g.249622  ORF Transcript_98345/g.249622 Transcript_98345/m.249622 type:complete len:797 (+) Transcript_98345:96-2486(+)
MAGCLCWGPAEDLTEQPAELKHIQVARVHSDKDEINQLVKVVFDDSLHEKQEPVKQEAQSKLAVEVATPAPEVSTEQPRQLPRIVSSMSRSTPGDAYTRTASTTNHVILEMTGDRFCLRTIHVSYTDPSGRQRQKAQKGYNSKVFIPDASTDIVVQFSVVGGAKIYKVDRNKPGYPWIKEGGKSIIDTFEYSSSPPQHVQFFLHGSSLRSWVADVDERKHSENLLEMVSRDVKCVRTMQVKYTDDSGQEQTWSGSGYNVKCHMQSSASNVEVTFSAVGGRKVYKVDRRHPKLPFIKDANGKQPLEKFVYSTLPSSVQFEIRGSSIMPYVSSVFENDIDILESADFDCSCSVDPPGLFCVGLDEMPGIGGIIDLQAPHSEFLLPAEVALFEPTNAEIFHAGSGARQIFLNTKLKDEETAKLKEFRQYLVEKKVVENGDVLPRYFESAALRIVHTSKGKLDKAVDLVKASQKERVRRLPIAETDVLDDLKGGFMYWHGRDKQCRPLLIIRLERIGAMAKDKERAVKAVLYSLEYALRYVLVPGRVENWVVLIDLENVLSVINPLSIGGMVGVASAIATALEKVYCGRMVWVKIINMPSNMLARAINGVIPAEKKDKVGFPTDVKKEIAPFFEPNQLEERYGGSAANTKPGDTYPYRFFPQCRGKASTDKGEEEQQQSGLCRTYSEWKETEDLSLHESTTLAFHEGALWDESSEIAKVRWLANAKAASLTSESAQAISKLAGTTVEPCQTVERFLELTNPEAVRGAHDNRAKTEIDWGSAEDPDATDGKTERSAAPTGV